MRRVIKTFTNDRGGYYAAVQEMHDQALRLTKMGLGKRFGVYVDKTLPRGHKNRPFAPWACWIVEKRPARRVSSK